MNSYKVVIGAVAAAGLVLAVASAHSDPHGMGAGNGPHAIADMQHGTSGTMGPGAVRQGVTGQGTGHAGLTPEEHTALQEKMRNARTPEERQKVAEAARTQMQQHAQDNGTTHSEHRGPAMSMGHSRGNTD